MKNFPRILVCPLDWGIGHATRCVPVIRKLKENAAEVLIGADGHSFDFLKQYFPNTEFIRMPGTEIKYPSGENMAFKMAIQAPEILLGIRKEHRLLEKIIKDHKIDAVISDNRFGIWSKDVYSVYITHQLRIKAPNGWSFTEPLLARIHRQLFKNCHECWIPDLPGEPNLSGDLGHPLKLPPNCYYIGPLSRFSVLDEEMINSPKEDPIDLLVLLSGPEPQRSIFEKIILKEMEGFRTGKAVILRGLPGNSETVSPLPHVKMHSHLQDAAMAHLIRTAKVIICRSGYSTLMDLASLGRSAVLVPTPGQTEQEYLGQYHSQGKSFYSMSQKSFKLKEVFEKAEGLVPPALIGNDQCLLDERIRMLIEYL